MASWFTRALDKVTPWNRGGEVQRRQEQAIKKKKREEEQVNTAPSNISVSVAQPRQNVVVDRPLEPKKPQNIFEDLNKNLTFGNPNSPLSIIKENAEAPRKPEPGEVIRPTVKVDVAQPRQNLLTPDGRRVSDIPDSPEIIINRGLDAGKSFEDIAKENNFKVDGIREYANATRPNYGIKIEKPKQGFGNKVRDIFDANTEADKFRRQEGNRTKGENKDITLVNPGNIVGRTPIVGTVLKMANTLGNQVPQVAFTVDAMVQNDLRAKLEDRLADAKRRKNSAEINEINQQLDRLYDMMETTRLNQEAADEGFQKNKGGLFNVGTLYDKEAAKRGSAEDALKDVALPTAVTMLDLYTLGQGSIVSQGIQQGGKTGLRTVTPNIIKAGTGNFASGAGGAYAEDASIPDALKAGAINSVLGTVPDVALPMIGQTFNQRILPRVVNGKTVNAADVVDELDEAAISASAETANQVLRPRNIPVRSIEDIPVQAFDSLPEPIRVRNLNEPGRLIQEFPGDASVASPNSLVQQIADETRQNAARDAFFEQNRVPARPDSTVEGIKPAQPTRPFSLTPEAVKSAQDDLIDVYAAQLRELGEGNGTQLIPDGEGGYYRSSNNVRFGDTSGKRMTKAMWREEAERQLREGKADPALQKAFDDAADPEVQALINQGEPTEAPVGRPIEVKQVNSIPVVDENIKVPTNLPETPGEVRVTTQSAPSNTKSAAIAVNTPPALPREVQEVLDNPKQFTKRQVQAARNQRKMARQVAKANEDTAAAMERIQTASPAAQSGEGFVPTGEFGKSANGGAYQKVGRRVELAQAVEETSQMSPGDVLKTARTNQAQTGGFNPRDIRNIHALLETKRVVRGTPEWQELRQILKEDGTVWGQQGALRNYTMRRTASASELINRYESKIYRLADDPTKIDSKLLDEVEAAEEVYVTARDEALAAYNRFTEAPTSANAKAYHAAQDAAEKADKAAKLTEYRVADKVLKGNKDIKQVRELEKMASEADLYQMDAVDASMLSGTGTFVRNFVNASIGGAEEGLFGGIASRIARKITGQNVGGGIGKGTLEGFGEGVSNIVDASKARASNAGWNPLDHIKNWATTGNQLGDTVIDSQIKRNVLDHYTQLLKDQGYVGRELRDRASVMARQDPDNLARPYASAARTAAGLGAGITRNNKIETIVKNMISDGLANVMPRGVSENAAKLITRMTIGFPTAIGRSLNEGVKRFTLGTPTFIKAFRTPDPAARALLIKEGIKQAGSGGLVIPPLFYAMGQAGLITGAYPQDDEERARWEREGITENSIKIGDSYYQLPAYLGSWAVPGLFYASLGRNDGDFSAAAADTAKIVPSILPTDNMSSWIDVVNGRSDAGKFMAQTGAGAVRATTPGGALLNQIAKSLDPTKNDTSSGTNWENFVDKVVTGVPGQNVFSDIPAKEDDAGNPIENPNPVAIALGASSKSQTKGQERSAQIQANVDTGVQQLNDVLNDPNLREVLDDKEKLIYDKVKAGKKLGEGDLKKLEDAFIKGVSSTGEDTAYLEREQYDTNLAALRLKRRKMEEDKTTKPSDLKKMDTAIKRGEIYKDNELPYEMIDAYQNISLEEWRKMGDPEDDAYDPDMYQKLWDIDTLMTEAGVSYKKGALDKQKYYAKEKDGGSGRGRSRASELSSDFGKLRGSDFAPSVRAYETIDQQTGSVPIIRTVRPNIVHKIGSSG